MRIWHRKKNKNQPCHPRCANNAGIQRFHSWFLLWIMALAKIISWVGHLNFWLLGKGAQTLLDVNLWWDKGWRWNAHSLFMRLRDTFDFISESSTRVDYLIERDAHWISAKWWSVNIFGLSECIQCFHPSIARMTQWGFKLIDALVSTMNCLLTLSMLFNSIVAMLMFPSGITSTA